MCLCIQSTSQPAVHCHMPWQFCNVAYVWKEVRCWHATLLSTVKCLLNKHTYNSLQAGQDSCSTRRTCQRLACLGMSILVICSLLRSGWQANLEYLTFWVGNPVQILHHQRPVLAPCSWRYIWHVPQHMYNSVIPCLICSLNARDVDWGNSSPDWSVAVIGTVCGLCASISNCDMMIQLCIWHSMKLS